jgi:diguanylate cyclase (GGDEF)-like protein
VEIIMSLIKQLWLAVALLMLTAFGISFVISTLTAKTYLEEQLYLKNLDNAASLALSMNQIPKDATLVELQLSAQFDTGHYQLIRLTAPTGEVMVERSALKRESKAPEWFKDAINIHVPAGIGTVMDGWMVYGNIELESQISYAYDTLWQSAIELLVMFALAALFSGLLGSWILKLITHPLNNVVEQAEAIGERRFVTNVEPKTLEFRQLVRSMNLLSNRIKNMLETETQRLEVARQKLQQDGLTGLLNRETFMTHLKAALTNEDASEQGYILMARLAPLNQINQELGHQQTDQLIIEVAEQFKQHTQQHPHWKAARLNGTDFALLISDHHLDSPQLIMPLQQVLQHYKYRTIVDWASISIGISTYKHNETIATVMMRVDACLASAELQPTNVFLAIETETAQTAQHYGLSDWKTGLETALTDEALLTLSQFAVRDIEDKLLHQECPVRLTVFGEAQKAGTIFPWIARLHWQDRVDLAVAAKAITQLSQTAQPLCINISAESLQSPLFREDLLRRLTQLAPSVTSLLWLDIPERGAYQHIESFRSFCLAIKPYACKIGLEHAGEHFARIAELNDLGLDYYKLDASFIRDIDQHTQHQSFVQGVITVAHAIGLLVIAEGVQTEHEKTCLINLGIDAMTGPAIQ